MPEKYLAANIRNMELCQRNT